MNLKIEKMLQIVIQNYNQKNIFIKIINYL